MGDAAFQQQVAALRADREHGASELARRALAILAESAHEAPASDAAVLLQVLRSRAQTLAAARPSMAPVQNLLRMWLEEVAERPPTDLAALRVHAAARADAIRAASVRAVDAVAQQASSLIQPGQTVITHSFSSTLLRTFERCRERNIHVIATESRPLYEGHKLAAQLSAWGVATTLITDAQMGLWMERADLALVGADSLLPDGAVINKVGTRLLALAAHSERVPFYVCCEGFKRRRAPLDGSAPDSAALEEMDPAELGAAGWPHVTIRNIYFERTPADLITAWVHEDGIHPPGARPRMSC